MVKIELKKNGEDIEVTNKNKKEYIKLYSHAKLIQEIKP